MASIYRRGNIWWGRARRKGVEKRISLETASKEVAKRRLDKWLNELEQTSWGEKPVPTFDDTAEKFVLEHLPTIKPSSAKRYAVSLVHLADAFEGKRLDEITSSAIYEFEMDRRKSGATPPTIRRDLACLSVIFTSAEDWEWYEGNPVPRYKRRRARRGGLKESPPRRRYLSIEEEQALLSECQPYLWNLISFAIDTGLRKEEQLSLMWEQLDLKKGEIHLTTGTKSGRERTVPLLPRAAQLLAQMPRHIRSPYVFVKSNGERYVSLHTGLANASERAKVKNLRWHDLRRTCGCRLLQDLDYSMEEVRQWFGHSTIAVTERCYAFLKEDALTIKAQKRAQDEAD